MSIKIVTDSTCDLPPQVVSDLGITVVPCYLNFGEDSYLDGIDLSKKQFYSRLRTDVNHPTTSAPNLNMFINVYKKLIAEGAKEIISIHVPESFSSIINIAKQAAKTFKCTKISVFDSGQLSLGTGFMVMAAARSAAICKTSEEIIKYLIHMVKNTYTFAILDTLDYLKKSGRLSQFKCKMGTLLDIKPMITLHMGEIKLDIVRTNIKALKKLIGQVKRLGYVEKIAVLHLDAPERALALSRQLGEIISKNIDYFFEEATPVLGVHLGPGAVGAICVRAEEKLTIGRMNENRNCNR